MNENDIISDEYVSDKGTTYLDIPAEYPEKDTKKSEEYYPISKPIPITIRAKIIHEHRS